MATVRRLLDAHVNVNSTDEVHVCISVKYIVCSQVYVYISMSTLSYSFYIWHCLSLACRLSPLYMYTCGISLSVAPPLMVLVNP